MKLYYLKGACSLASYISLCEAGVKFDAAAVDRQTRKTPDGEDFAKVNPKGYVPALALDSGEVLTENAVILQYLGDRANWPEVLPPMGDFRRYRVLEMVNFITTELHKRFGFLFNPDATDEMKQLVIAEIGKKLDYVDQRLGAGPYLFGTDLTLPDPYLFVMARWTDKMLGGLDRWPNLRAFYERMQERHSVRNVLRFERLLEEEPAA